MARRRFLTPVVTASLLAAGVAVAAPSAPSAVADTVPAVSLAQHAVRDTASGTDKIVAVPGGGYAVVSSFGSVSAVSPSGASLWQATTQGLYRSWGVSFQQTQPVIPYPQLPWGTDPVNPLELVGPGSPGLVNDANPVAAGVLGGRPVVAVAETGGINIDAENIGGCPGCLTTWPFSVPGSDIHIGTFVSVLDARTGHMLWHTLDGGFVTQLAITGGRLVIGDEDGDPKTSGGVGEFGSVTTVRALSFSASGLARQAWQFSTRAPWARLLGLSLTSAGVAVAWSDTPTGLGVPGPADGHVLMLNAATGAVRWRKDTPGYPVLTAADNARGALAVVQESDPAVSLGYTLTGLRYSDGAAVSAVSRSGSVPLSLAAGSGGWAVGSDDATFDTATATYTPSAGRVTLASPGSDRAAWSVTLPGGAGPALPGGLVITGGEVVAGSWLGFITPTAAQPENIVDSLTALSLPTGRALWSRTGDPGDPISLAPVAGGLARTVNSHQLVLTYQADGRAAQSTAGPGDFLSGVTASISAPGAADLVAGNENGDVYAMNGKALAAGRQRVLWRAHLPGPVQDIVKTSLNGRAVLVAAATSAVGVIDQSTGRVLRVIPVPGTYTWSVTVAGGAAVVPGTSLTAYSLATGQQLWSYPAPAGAMFSDAAAGGGMVAAEYSSPAATLPDGTIVPAATAGALALHAATGQVAWTAPAPATVGHGDLDNGTYASADIAGANGDGVAFAWTDADTSDHVDVRDIVTGALDYSDQSGFLNAFSQFLSSPQTGLMAVSQNGAAMITPAGATQSFWPTGTSASLATSPSGTPALLTANNGVRAFGLDLFGNPQSPSASPTGEADAGTYLTGTLVPGDFAGDGTRQAVGLAANALTIGILLTQTGGFEFPNLSLAQHGLAVLSLTDASSAPAAQSASAAALAPAAASAGAPAPALPKPVGEPGAPVPSAEPGHAGQVTPGVTVRHTVTAADPPAPPPGYSPAQVDAGYLGLTGTGKGQTIAITDAFDDPGIVADAQTFSEQFGLPGVCGAGGAAGDCFDLDVSEQSATAGSDPGWGLETALDVEWAHALAPDATIRLYEGSQPTFASLFAQVAAAQAGAPDAVSMSWGYSGGEFSEEGYYDHFCTVATSVCVVSAGDAGHPGSYPAYNPAALSVGGTTLTLEPGGSVDSEQAWPGSGGGQSWVEPEPGYQRGVQSSGHRQMPDVSFDADVATGVAVYDSLPDGGQTGWFEVGGTSVGAPVWSGILADAGQLRAAAGLPRLTAAGDGVQKAVYSLPSGALFPVTTGPDNGFCPVGCAPAAGYDEITGLGSPRAGIDAALAAASG